MASVQHLHLASVATNDALRIWNDLPRCTGCYIDASDPLRCYFARLYTSLSTHYSYLTKVRISLIILGLISSPIMRSTLKGLEEIERTLDATCRSPNLHRELVYIVRYNVFKRGLGHLVIRIIYLYPLSERTKSLVSPL